MVKFSIYLNRRVCVMLTETSLHLYQICVLPVLLYGMEVVFPRPKFVEVLKKFSKHNLKHIMSLPVTTADPAVYILSGSLPVEVMIHQRVLNFFGMICRLSESSVEKQYVSSPSIGGEEVRQQQLVCGSKEIVYHVRASWLWKSPGWSLDPLRKHAYSNILKIFASKKLKIFR